jgi:hypothetical protein
MLAHAVRLGAVAFGVFALLSVTLLFAHTFWQAFRRRVDAPRLARANEFLHSLLQPVARPGERTAAESHIEWLRSQPARIHEALLLPVARSLDRDACAPVLELAHAIGLVARAEKLCCSRFWWRRLRGARVLTVLRGGDTVMPLLLHDAHAVVRAQAAEWAASQASPRIVATLLEHVNDPESFSRFAVQDALVRMGDLAVDHVRRYLEEHKDALADGALRVAFAMADPRFVPVATRLAQNPNAEVRARAVALLGAVGAADEVAPVTAHLTDPEPAVRAAAARALGRMGHWPRAPALASLMRDTSWDVRRAAGLALRDLGSPGLIMLRKMSTDANQFAADMARQVLDLPETAVGATA